MADYSNRGGDDNIYGAGGGTGAWAMIILVVVVLWVLFRDGHKDGYGSGYGGGYGHFDGCGPCVRPSFIDESNYEEERNLQKKLCKVDEDIHCEGEKTRALIEQNYIQDLRDKLAAVEMEKLTLKQEMFTEKKFDQLERMNERRFDQLAGAIGKIDCELPKRPPVFAECVTPNTHDIDCHDRFRDFPRRGRCDGFGFEGCCA